MNHNNWTRLLSVFTSLTGAVLVLFLFTGCSSEGPNTPEAPPVYKGENVPFAWAPTAGTDRSPNLSSGSDEWYPVASVELDDDGGTVSGSRYTLTVPENAWDEGDFGEDVLFTISERNAAILDVEFGPEGIQFEETVILTVDYAGTNVDPDSPNYDGSSPGFFFYNPATDEWEPLAGTHNPSAKTLEVQLHHFSRYALLGTPGWYGTWGTPGW